VTVHCGEHVLLLYSRTNYIVQTLCCCYIAYTVINTRSPAIGDNARGFPLNVARLSSKWPKLSWSSLLWETRVRRNVIKSRKELFCHNTWLRTETDDRQTDGQLDIQQAHKPDL